MKEVPHGIVILKPKQPYVDWASDAFDDEHRYTLADFQQERTAFLVRDELGARGVERLLKKHHKELFEQELEGWCLDMETWPRRRGWKTFQEWFSWEYHSVMFELR